MAGSANNCLAALHCMHHQRNKPYERDSRAVWAALQEDHYRTGKHAKLERSEDQHKLWQHRSNDFCPTIPSWYFQAPCIAYGDHLLTRPEVGKHAIMSIQLEFHAVLVT